MRLSNNFLALALSFSAVTAFAQDPIEHTWLTEEKNGKVQIYKATDGKYYGKLVWIKEPNENGRPKVDKNNPDKARRNDPLLGVTLLKGFKKTKDNVYEDGTVYDPKNGKDYSCKLTLDGSKLNVRGYVGISLMGRTTTWTRVD